MSHKAALPPLLSYGLDMEERFQQSKKLLECSLPMEQPPLLDEDLRFAAWASAHLKDSLVAFRKGAVGVLRELKRRLTSVTEHLRSFQPAQIRAATARRDLGSQHSSWWHAPGLTIHTLQASFWASRRWVLRRTMECSLDSLRIAFLRMLS